MRDSLQWASALTILGLLAAAGLALWLTGLPQGGDLWDIHYDTLGWKDRLTIAGAVAAGAGAAIALVVSYRKQRDAEEGKFAAAFAAGAAQLGDQAPAVRMAGAYALAALADRHPDRRQQCVDALCGYLRLHYTPEADKKNLTSTTLEHDDTKGTKHSDVITYRPGDREVRLTIVAILRNHLTNPRAADNWCSLDLDFTGATLENFNFAGVHLAGQQVLFAGTSFSGERVSFDGASFSGEWVSFDGASFSTEQVSFTGASFSGKWVSFEKASFSTVWFDGASFSGEQVWFDGASFSGKQVSFDGASFLGKWVWFYGASFPAKRVFFAGASFSAEQVSFGGASFSGKQVSFYRATFSGKQVSFDEASFSGEQVWFDEATMGDEVRVSFVDADILGAVVTRDGVPFRGWPI